MFDSPMQTIGWAAVLSGVAYVVAERRLRARWRLTSVHDARSTTPYRTSSIVVTRAGRAPALVRAACSSGVLLGGVAVPAVIYAMPTLQSDGIAVSLLPALACAAAVWLGAWLLLARARIALDVARTAALATTAAHVGILVLATVHVFAARLGWSDRASPSYVAVAFLFALVALPQAALLRAAVARVQAGYEQASPT